VYITVFGFTIFALAAVGMELGHLALTATEVQTIADVGATAGARAMVTGGDGLAEAQEVVSENSVNATFATITADEFRVGYFDGATRTFTPDGNPENAVRVTTSATVGNFLAGVFGELTSTVQKQATAVYMTISSTNPGFPIAVRDCDANCTSTGQCDLGNLDQVPGPGTSSWTSLETCNPCSGGASAQDILAKIPEPSACQCNACGGGESGGLLKVNDNIELNSGQVTSSIFRAIDCLLDQNPPQDTFVIPMIDCDTATSTQGTVSGFATVEVECVQAPGVTHTCELATQCTSGANIGDACTSDQSCHACQGTGRNKTCSGGTRNGQSCQNDAGCLGVCLSTWLCSGGSHAGQVCTSDQDCPQGECGATGKYIKLRAIFNAGVPGPPGGCAGCGTGFIGLVS
jgi:hypothetical protein